MHLSHLSGDDNLHFGVLALEENLIAPDQFIRASRLWSTQQDVSLGELLVQQGWLSAAGKERIDAQLAARARPGGEVSTAAYTAPDSPSFCPDSPSSRPTHEQRRFTLLQPYRQGGLGQVSLARDESLRRQVALKEIRPDRLDNPAARRRFLMEAEITGQLEHPGIVPVYALGQDDAGNPYYAMRFIQGTTLSEAIAAYHRRPTSRAFRALLKRFLDVCQTIAFAHSKGVIHRDLKPANILLGDYGETLVADWGLAKRLGDAQADAAHRPSAAAEAAANENEILTQAGQVLGSPPYMAPEQAAGAKPLGPSADIYSLGAILYQILTGRPPYQGEDAAAVLAKVVEQDAAAPSAVQRGVPRALEAICRRAMARQPEERYDSARDLAEDIEHWLGDEPVGAYRERLPARLGRWGRRHRPLMAASAALLLTAVVALAVSTVLIGWEKTRAESNLELALKESTRADDNARQLTASQDLSGRFQDDLANLLVEMTKTGRLDLAERNYLRALANSEKLVAAHPEVPAYRRNLASNYNGLGYLYRDLKQNDKAEAAYLKALALRQELARQGPADVHDQRMLAAVYNNLGEMYHIVGPQAKADDYTMKALAVREKLARDYPDVLQFKVDLAGTYGNQANFLRQRSPTESLVWYGKSIDVLEEALRSKQGDDEVRQFLRNGSRGRALALTELGRHAEALKDWERAIAADSGRDWHADVLQASRAACLVRLGEHARAAAAATALAAKKDLKADILYDLACVQALSAAAAKDAGSSEAARHAGDAMILLTRARSAGFFNPRENRNLLRSDRDLDGLRGRDDFRRLMQELK